MSERPRILVVDDEPALQHALSRALALERYEVSFASDGREALERLGSADYEAVVLDVSMPRLDGLEVCRRMRAAGDRTPVLMLTARTEVAERVEGLEAGADDYLAKPFAREELVARLRALLRRAAGHASSDLTVGPVRLDARAGRVTVNGAAVKLTSHEYRLLSYLMHHAGRIISRTEIVEHLYEQDFDRDSNTIEVFIGRLRKKLGVDIIKTVRGLGYAVGVEEETPAGR